LEYFDLFKEYGHEQVIFNTDPETGLKAIIAIHNTVLGPALGGCRMRKYSSEADAIIDALKLSRGMTYKNAAVDLPYGGGKSVIIGDPMVDKNPKLMESFGRFVQTLKGRFITGPDMGTNLDDFENSKKYTPHVITWQKKMVSSDDISLNTAYGVYIGIKACLKQIYDDDSLDGRIIAVQGLGKVGYSLCKYLAKEGAKLIVSEQYQDKIDKVKKEFGAESVGEYDIYSVKCDVFSPCAVGAIINDETISQFKCPIIAGSANNQLEKPRHGDKLHEMGILYAPDYVINAGGLINVYKELTKYSEEGATNMVLKIYDNVKKVIEISKRDNIPTYIAADRAAEERIAKIRTLKVLSKINGSKIRSGY
jgi:leucine dehydrogenase